MEGYGGLRVATYSYGGLRVATYSYGGLLRATGGGRLVHVAEARADSLLRSGHGVLRVDEHGGL